MLTQFEVRCDMVDFGKKMIFVFYKIDFEKQIEEVVAELSMDKAPVVKRVKDGEEVKPLFSLTLPQVNGMMSNITSMLDAKGMKLDIRSNLEMKIEGLENVLEEKNKMIDVLKQVIADYKSNGDKFIAKVLED